MGLTPMMQQYLEIKDKYKDCILFFRLGDFYEMFFEDAEIASRELEIALTGRDCGLEKRAPMCGVPFHSADTYIARLIEKGYKVAICEQLEDPKFAKGIVKRDITRIITPGTIIDSNMLDEKVNNFIASVYFNIDKVAISIADVSTGDFYVTSFIEENNKLMNELSKFKPSEMLIIKNSFTERFETLVLNIKSRFNLLINYVEDKSSESLSNKDYSHLNEYEKVSAVNLLKYLNETQKSSLDHISSITRYKTEDFMLIDSFTRRNLELTETMRSRSKKGTLIDVLDKTQTAMGGRLIRKWIEEPLLIKDEIEKRLEAVEELIDNIYISSDLREFLRGIYDIERIMGKISCETANARDLISLKQSIRFLPDIRAAISNCKSILLSEIYRDFDELGDIFQLIDESIDENPPITIKEGGIIKTGFNQEIDKLRDAMTNGKNWIAELEQKERDLTGIKSLKIGYNKVFGYYLEVTKSNLSSIPQDRYIRKQTLANAERFITPELKEMEEIVSGAESKVVDLEYDIFVHIRNKIYGEVSRIKKVAHYLAIIDSLLSFAKVSFENNYTKPKITDDGVIEIKEGRHPVVEKMISGVFVPNDTMLDNKEDMVIIITGPNMAGKSTYLRQVALITLMAQIGCFVPAASAKISIVDRIFTRIGASDDLSLGQSTFMVEMSEVSNILNNATKNSLLILDEVGRGTSTFDGLSIAWAVIEFISQRIGAKTLFATHYHELTELEGKIDGVKNYCISVKEHGEDIIFLRKIIRGGADQSYGIQVAKLAGLPSEVIDKAKEILEKLEESDISKKLKTKTKPAVVKEAAATLSNEINLFNYKENELIEEIKSIDVLNITPIEAINKLYSLVNKAKGLR
ncbi:DNA mismatch repair protein MutS [Caloramator mitchellensis]|uniref:DNA mismatch repair protein MutS n=1 Tax=Caloramator mitchellensis TaxID=908809 RepID=A0A0R3K297_CALMK|nr:DNA mismatch repair protein MutS [Caloramator mitchellensis]KRQ87026.1 DNA mismatch repair protein MutS [Caloramator mitchellensis]